MTQIFAKQAGSIRSSSRSAASKLSPLLIGLGLIGSGLVGSGLLDTQAKAQQGSTPASGKTIVLEAPRVALINDVKVPTQTEGMLTSIVVEEGMIVEQGQTLAVIDDRQARITLSLKQAEEKEAQLNADNTVNLRDAKNSLALESEKARAFAKIAKENAMPFWEAETQRMEAERQSLRLELAVLNQEIAVNQFEAKKFERQLADLEITKRNIVAPFAGFVEMRVAQLGEWVQPGSPILQLVQMDRLRAQGFHKAANSADQIRVGMAAVIEFELGNNSKEYINGTVGFVGNDVDLSQRRRVWIEFENKRVENGDWLIKPGMTPTIRINP